MPIYRGKYNQQIYYGDKKVLGIFAGDKQVYSSEPLDSDLIMRSITTFSVPYGTKEIGILAFNGCNDLTSIVLPQSVTAIRSSAFYYCTRLEYIYIPASVSSIFYNGNSAFMSCNSLTDIYCGFAEGDVPGAPWGAANRTIHYDVPQPSGTQETFIKSATAQMIDKSITTAIIPDSVTRVGQHAFSRCFSLSHVEIPDTVRTIGDNAFAYCYSLRSIYIPSSVTYISSSAFSNCSSLTDIYCGFAEGAVYGAPWGASHATIHYNSSRPA